MKGAIAELKGDENRVPTACAVAGLSEAGDREAVPTGVKDPGYRALLTFGPPSQGRTYAVSSVEAGASAGAAASTGDAAFWATGA